MTPSRPSRRGSGLKKSVMVKLSHEEKMPSFRQIAAKSAQWFSHGETVRGDAGKMYNKTETRGEEKRGTN